jgi:DNA-binding NtrC family response regulator
LNRNLPVVIITGFITEETVLDLKIQGAYDCLVKPFTPEQLRTMVRRALDESA